LKESAKQFIEKYGAGETLELLSNYQMADIPVDGDIIKQLFNLLEMKNEIE